MCRIVLSSLIALAVEQNSDVVAEGEWGNVMCRQEFDVGDDAGAVTIHADYGPPCRINVKLASVASVTN